MAFDFESFEGKISISRGKVYKLKRETAPPGFETGSSIQTLTNLLYEIVFANF